MSGRQELLANRPFAESVSGLLLLNLVICLMMALGVFLLTIAIARGNFLIIAGPVALWAFVVFMGQTGNVKAREQKNRRRGKTVDSPLAGHKGLICKAVGTVLLLIVTMCVWLPKVRGGLVSDREIEEAMSDARMLLGNGHVEEAILRLRAIDVPNSLSGRNAEKYHNLGASLIRVGRLEEAYDALEKAVVYDAKDIEAYLFLAKIAYDKGAYSESLCWLNKVKKLNPYKKGLPKLEVALKTQLQKENHW